jgi:pimeloyl-ACP methyl ester carboxylesterase
VSSIMKRPVKSNVSPSASIRRLRVVAAAASLGVAAGCGGGDVGDAAGAPASHPTRIAAAQTPRAAAVVGPGELRSATPIRTVGLDAMAAVLDTAPELGVRPKYPVRTYRLTYITKNGDGAEIVASGLVATPVKADGRASPVMSWQHGTLFRDADVPGNSANESEATVLLASQGYIVVAADYIGYGASKGVPHPYLESAPTAAAVVDLLTAAKTWRQESQVPANDQLFMAGYSEGAYATVAALRSMETTGSPHLATLVGVAAGAGPYSVTATMDAALEIVRSRSELLRWLAWPGLLKNLSSSTRTLLRQALVSQLVPQDADVTVTTTFIDLYLADDTAAMETLNNVHNWRPIHPVLLHHGRDDRTVGYSVATRTVSTMRARGSTSVSLTDCPARPAGHLECVVPYFSFLLNAAGSVARDL